MTALIATAAGVLAWTFVEYGMHHWNGHLLKGRTLFSREHLHHHAVKDYFSTFSNKVAAAVPVSIGAWVLAGLIFDFRLAGFFTLGLVGGYAMYEYIHWANHMLAPKTAYGTWARRHHFSHHFSDARFNHGVTTPFWDLVFGTYRKPGRIRVPNKLAMEWLFEESCRTINSKHSQHYELIGVRPSAAKSSR